MPRRTVITLECNFCGKESPPLNDKLTVPGGWFYQAIDHAKVEWTTVECALCPHCYEKVRNSSAEAVARTVQPNIARDTKPTPPLRETRRIDFVPDPGEMVKKVATETVINKTDYGTPKGEM
jgi:hypothetical protein